MDNLVSRQYRSRDFSACMAIFDSNVPTFFALQERKEFCEYLQSINTAGMPFLVFLHKGSIVACGGLTIEPDKRQASLSWGMVGKAFHRQGLGTHLVEARLTLARSIPEIDELVLATSQHTHGFYERFGFVISKITPDGFGSGLDRWDMTLRFE
ncbi:GNAT family N-acetyltransferase [Brucella pituitosa]|nr:GNAT family N-acetyltransferase [Brucella pituitosa]PJO48845.1 GNAT family N-acetyltransferase [Brucella pituitosa]PRA82644.1 GNAT family N-acetyltransferase [Ochrobactrum sp. MYb29]